MKINMESIDQSGHYGMPLLYMRAFLLAAQQKNIVIGVRMVSLFSKQLICTGFPTKPFIVKNKTANMGVVAGCISMSPVYSRALENAYGEYIATIENACLNDSSFRPTELFLSAERIQELQHLFKGDMVVTDLHDVSIGNKKITWTKDGAMISAYAKEQDGTFQMLDENKMPILVLGKVFVDEHGVSSVRPITSDFDLLVICPSYDEFDPAGFDKTPIDTQQAVSRALEEGSLDPREDPMAGNWSPRIAQAVECINQTIGQMEPLRRLPELKTVHHNAEFTNPFAHQIEGCLPSLLVFPKPMDLSGLVFLHDEMPSHLTNVDAVLIESLSEMVWIRDFLRDQGYYWPSHARYAGTLSPFRPGAIEAAGRKIASTVQQRHHHNHATVPTFFGRHSKKSDAPSILAGLSCGCV